MNRIGEFFLVGSPRYRRSPDEEDLRAQRTTACVPGVCTGRVYYSANEFPKGIHNIHLNTSQPLHIKKGTHFTAAV